MQEGTANYYSFSDIDGSVQIKYYPRAPGPLIAGQAVGPRLEYQGPEGTFVYPSSDALRGNVDTLQVSPLGSLLTVVLVSTVDAKAVHLTLLLPPMNMEGKREQDINTLAIKTTSYGILPKAGAQLTYEVIFLNGVAQNILLAM